MDVTLEPVTGANLHVLRNLYTLFRYELLRYLSDYPGCDLNEHGTFEEGCRSHDEWSESVEEWLGNLEAFLIRADDRLAGFTAVARPPYAHDSVDHRVHDFFILNKFARQGVGRRAVEALCRRFPGRWEVVWGAENAPAAAFWRRVVADLAPCAHELCVVEETRAYEGGPGLRFEIEP